MIEAKDPFDSLAQMQASHGWLVKQVGSGSVGLDHIEQVVDFIRRGLATGTVLDAKEDRAAAQGLINFWTTRLVAAKRDARRHSTEPAMPGTLFVEISYDLDDTLLEEFDSRSYDTAQIAADEWISSLSEEDRDGVRHILMRLVRLSESGRIFTSMPATRVSLYDIFGLSAQRADQFIAALAKAGVVRVTVSGSPTADQIALRSDDLLTNWQTLKGYFERRLDFRDIAMKWQAGGGSANLLVSHKELEDFRTYQDRNELERHFIEKSRAKEWRVGLRNRTLLYVAAPLLLTALVGWCAAVSQTSAANKLLTTLQEKQYLAEMTAIVRTLAVLGNSTSAENNIALIRLDAIAKEAPAGSEAKEFFVSNKELLNDIRRLSDSDPSESGEFSKAVGDTRFAAIKLARTVKDKIISKADPNIVDRLKADRDVIFDVVESCAEHLVSVYENNTYDAAEAYRKEFWVLYWGEMGLVEGKEVNTAMVEFGTILGEIRRKFVVKVGVDISQKIKDDGATELPEKLVPGDWQTFLGDQQLAIVKWSQTSPVFVDKVNSYLPAVRTETQVDRELLRRLKDSLKNLQAKLALERQQPLVALESN